MHSKRVHPLFLTLLMILKLHAAKAFIIEGRLNDEQGNGISYATIQVQGNKIGTYSLVSGDFSLQVPSGKHTLIIKSLGYKTKYQEIYVSEDIRNLEIKLDKNTANIGEVVVGPDKAKLTCYILIMAKEKRKNREDSLRSYKAKAYAKYSLSYAKTSLISGVDTVKRFSEKDEPELVESYSDVFFTSPKKYKEIVLGFRDYSYTSVAANEGTSVSVSATVPGQRQNAYGAERFVT